MSACPVCNRRQDDGIMCHRCCTLLEYELGDPEQGVAALVVELDTTLARQGRGERLGKGGLAHQRNGFHEGASLAAGVLTNTLSTWARDITGDTWRPALGEHQDVACAVVLLDEMTAIRRHPDAYNLWDQIVDAVQQARHAIDRAANRTIIPVGPCPEEDENGAACTGEVFAFIPTEDDRPSRMECKKDSTHKWGSVQFYRTGARIRRKAEAMRIEGAA